MLSTILIIVLILLLIGALPTWPYSGEWGYYPGGGLGIAGRLRRLAVLDFGGEALDAPAIMRFREIFAQAVDHGVADLIERVHFLPGVVVALGKPEAGVMEGVPAAVAARQRHGRG